MLYYIFYSLKDLFSPFNVFGYITVRSILAIITSFLFILIFGKRIICRLKENQITQVIRTDGPSTHQVKSGTPTMGGLIILFSILFSVFLWARLDNRFILWTSFCVLWLGGLGFLDDYIKLVRKNSKGLIMKWKLAGQVLFALIVCIYIFYYPPNIKFATSINIPYLKEVYINLGIFYTLFAMIVIIGSSNAVNLTDGLDGLAIGNITIVCFVYAIFAYLVGNVKFAEYLKIIPVSGAGELTVFLSAMGGAGLGFLWYNSYPAEVFMGDTGSLFLGGAVGLISVFIRMELVLVIACGVFVAEVLSVIIQVLYFKRYRKRVFRMAPLHHHFELGGLAETKVTIRLWIVGIALALIAMSSLKIR